LLVLRDASVGELQAVPDVGEVVAKSVRTFLDEPRNRQLFDRLAAAGVRTEDDISADQRPARQPLAGQTFVLTGTLEHLTREAAAEQIERAGSKLEKARALGIPQLDEAGFAALIMKATAS
jgi:DNA ligase (NAD+)